MTLCAYAAYFALMTAAGRMRKLTEQARDRIDWASAAEHETGMRERVPPAAMQVIDDTGRWIRDRRGGRVYPYLITCTCERAEQACRCEKRWNAGVLGGFGPGLRVIAVGDSLLAGPVGVVRFVMAHERCHASGWLYYSCRARLIAGSAGFVVVGALTPPLAALIIAVLVLRLACTAWGWCEEIACDIAAARLHGRHAPAWFHTTKRIDARQRRVARPWRQRVLSLAFRALPMHPPLRLRAWICRLVHKRHPAEQPMA